MQKKNSNQFNLRDNAHASINDCGVISVNKIAGN